MKVKIPTLSHKPRQGWGHPRDFASADVSFRLVNPRATRGRSIPCGRGGWNSLAILSIPQCPRWCVILDKPSRLTLAQGAGLLVLLFLLLLIPLVLSNHPAGTALGGLFFVVIFFFSGYLLLSAAALPIGLRFLLSPVFGILGVTTLYDAFARASWGAYFFYIVIFLSGAGIVLFALRVRCDLASWGPEDSRAVLAGSIVALSVAPMFWRSGRFSGGEFVFHGPAGQDHLFHVTLLQRLLQHVPPDNFMFAGLRPSVYHYFDDQTLALVLRAQHTLHLSAIDLFDLYYRCYPTIVYFLLGAFAYLVGRQILGTTKGGVLGVLLLMGAGGLGWIVGILQTAAHATHLVAMRERLFTTWTAWDGVDAIRPLVHRPAHYHSLLICLAAISLLLRPGRTRRDWSLAGLLLGLMAGFNFTLAATFGAAAVFATLLLFLRGRKDLARDLAWLTFFLFVGSLPVNAEMLLSGFHNEAPGFPFRGPNLEFSTSVWGMWLAKVLPAALVPLAALILLPIVAYGFKLFGVGALARLDLGEERHRGIAALLAVVFVISFVIGTFFPYQGFGVAIIFLQPTFWILGLFSLRPIGHWLERNQPSWRALALWGVLGLTWIQALLAFNLSYKTTFSQETMHALQDVRATAPPDDVVAYLPSDIVQQATWGYSQGSTNFAIMALTGLDGYCSSQTYSVYGAVPGLSGKSPAEVMDKAERLYEQRRADVDSFVRGSMSADAAARLTNDHVRWIVVFGDAMREISTPVIPWRKTRQIAIYRLSP